MSKSKNLCKASALTLSALTAGCQLYPPTVCGPTFDGLSPNAQVVYEVSPVYGEDPRHLIPEYSFEGQPGETVTLVYRPAGFALLGELATESYNSREKRQVIARVRGSYCGEDARIQMTVTLPPDEDGIYYMTVNAILDRISTPTEFAVTRGPLESNYVRWTGLTPANQTALTNNLATNNLVASAAPEPIYGNTGKYMSPFTEDGTIAPWVEKSMAAAAGAGLGGAVGAYAGQKALEQVPFFGGLLGSMAGKAAGREIALSAAGGWDFIRANSDLSFNSLDDMARYLQAHHASHPQYAEVLKATYEIYPELQQSIRAVGSRR